ncbi:endonuclease VII domain-containing protein [Streptomyces sp. NRRL S-448]|uniref:endonuclease VII domain-containing protein n=2 Tax=Streptomyces TaxID=1883 RepID=UPI003564C772
MDCNGTAALAVASPTGSASGRWAGYPGPVPLKGTSFVSDAVKKPHSEWHRNSSASDGLATRCKACRAVDGRAGHLKRSYGMTEADRDEMIDAQGGLCCICLKRPAVHVDHCHKTGRVRGVLCFNCNTAIGKLGDDPDAARRVVSYLEGHAWKPTIVAQGVYRQPS